MKNEPFMLMSVQSEILMRRTLENSKVNKWCARMRCKMRLRIRLLVNGKPARSSIDVLGYT